MNTQEVELLLAYCAAADPRFNTADELQARARVAVWQGQLEDADALWVNDWVRRHYSKHHDWPLTVGAVRTAWSHEVTRRESFRRGRALRERALLSRPKPDASHEVIEECKRQARDATTPERPMTGRLRTVSDAVFNGG